MAARERSGAGPLTLGAMLGRPASTVGKVLRRLGRSRLPREPRPPMVRHERERPGELLHIDTKKLGRFWNVGKRILGDGVTRSPRAGWQHVHVAVDDHSRLAYAEVLPSDRRHDALLERTLRFFAEQGVTVEAVMTDNGAAYASHARWSRCDELGLHHPRTRPYTPRTNGKAERFIQMLLRSWAYALAYPTSARRTRALAGWLRWYNRRRPHGSLGGLPPVSRVSHLSVVSTPGTACDSEIEITIWTHSLRYSVGSDGIETPNAEFGRDRPLQVIVVEVEVSQGREVSEFRRDPPAQLARTERQAPECGEVPELRWERPAQAVAHQPRARYPSCAVGGHAVPLVDRPAGQPSLRVGPGSATARVEERDEHGPIA